MKSLTEFIDESLNDNISFNGVDIKKSSAIVDAILNDDLFPKHKNINLKMYGGEFHLSIDFKNHITINITNDTYNKMKRIGVIYDNRNGLNKDSHTGDDIMWSKMKISDKRKYAKMIFDILTSGNYEIVRAQGYENTMHIKEI